MSNLRTRLKALARAVADGCPDCRGVTRWHSCVAGAGAEPSPDHCPRCGRDRAATIVLVYDGFEQDEHGRWHGLGAPPASSYLTIASAPPSSSPTTRRGSPPRPIGP
jgi:hypothetical protein